MYGFFGVKLKKRLTGDHKIVADSSKTRCEFLKKRKLNSNIVVKNVVRKRQNGVFGPNPILIHPSERSEFVIEDPYARKRLKELIKTIKGTGGFLAKAITKSRKAKRKLCEELYKNNNYYCIVDKYKSTFDNKELLAFRCFNKKTNALACYFIGNEEDNPFWDFYVQKSNELLKRTPSIKPRKETVDALSIEQLLITASAKPTKTQHSTKKVSSNSLAAQTGNDALLNYGLILVGGVLLGILLTKG